MKVTSEKAEHSQVTLDVEMEPPELEKYMEIAYRHVVQRTNIPGFRKGKAPRAVLERHLGRGALVQDAIEHLVPEAVQKAIDEQKIEAIARPEIELVSLEPVRFKAKVPLRPTVTLCDYAKIRVPAVPVEVAEEAVDHTVDQLRQQQSVFTPVDREVRYNDIISMNISGCVGEKQLVDEQETPYRVMKDFDLPLPGFAEKLEGAQRGEERQFSLVFPDQHPSVEFRGKECDFKVKVTDIKEQSLPELDDAFAKSLNMTVETVAALKEKVRKDLEARAAAEERARFEDAALEKLVVCATIDYPSVLLENEIEEMFRREEENAKRSGQKLKDRLRAMNKTEEQLREGLRPVAEKRLLRSLALGKLSDEEKITVKDEDMASETEKMAAGAGDKAEELKKFLDLPSVKDSVSNAILTRKTVERLLEIARQEEAAPEATVPSAEQGPQEKAN